MMTENPSKMHSLRRTNPKGQPFVGTCVLCGREGLTFADLATECDNQRGISADEAVVEAVSGEQSDEQRNG